MLGSILGPLIWESTNSSVFSLATICMPCILDSCTDRSLSESQFRRSSMSPWVHGKQASQKAKSPNVPRRRHEMGKDRAMQNKAMTVRINDLHQAESLLP